MVFIREIIKSRHHSFLSSPPFHARMPRLAISSPHTTRSRASASDHEDIRHLILEEKIGGVFWGKKLPRSFQAILSLPDDCPEAVAWEISRELANRYKRTEILLLVPCLTSGAKRLARSLCLTCAAAEELDPHALLASVRTVIAFNPASCQKDICQLAALQNKNVEIIPHAHMAEVCHLAADDVLCEIVEQTHYICPFTGQGLSCREAIQLLVFWKSILKKNREIGACLGISLWKRPRIAAFLATASGSPRFFQSVRAAMRECRLKNRSSIAVWATRLPANVTEDARNAGLSLLLMEDGFIRSIGLGSALQPPASIFLDRRGIYYDPSRESDLEHILAFHPFDDTLRKQAVRLLAKLRSGGFSKYGKAAPSTGGTGRPSSRRIILVPGQVADDLSVLRGGGRIKNNLALLRAVRETRPDAYIIYRPHPDVEAGYRKGTLPDEVIVACADEIDRHGNIASLLTQVDEVHTLTSLAGFEALIRGIPVTTYGAPFYAGWGLTTDRGTIPDRRNRLLSLEELVAGTLVLYPRYLDPVTRLPCPLEIILDRFEQPDAWRPTPWMYLRRAQIAFLRAIRRLTSTTF